VETSPADDAIISILKAEMIHEMDAGFDFIDKLLDETRDNGIIGAIMHHIEKFVFSYFARDTARSKTIKQMELIFKASCEMKYGASMQDVGKKYFKGYLHDDETYARCDKHHAKYPIIIENIKAGFESRVNQALEMLEKGKGSSYAELVRTTFGSKDEVKKFLAGQLLCVKNEIDVLTTSPDILKVPMAKKRILEIIVKGYDYALNRVYTNLDQFFDTPA
jgi:hypothetical protein